MTRAYTDRTDLPPELRLVSYAYQQEFGHPPAGVWHSPGVVTLLSNAGATLSVTSRWGAIVAAEPRDDGILELAWMNRPAERLRLPTTALTPVTASPRHPTAPAAPPPGATDPAAAPAPFRDAARLAPATTSPRDGAALGPAWALQEAGHRIGGVTLLISVDLPAGSGLSATTATACAVALALRDLYAQSVPAAALPEIISRGLHCFGVTEANETGRCATTLLAPTRTATLWHDPDNHIHLPFDPTAAALRLMVVDTRVRGTTTNPAPEQSNLNEAAAALSTRNPASLGAMLTKAHTALAEAAHPHPAQTLAVTAALEAGALGARMIWDGPGRPICVLLPADDLGEIRTAIRHAYTSKAHRTPRFLTVTPTPAAHRAG